MEEESHLIKYYGDECVHCKEMDPLVKQLEKENGVKVVGKEVYHNSKNQAQLMKDAEGKCQGIPFFINKKNGKFICGATSYDKLKAWAE